MPSPNSKELIDLLRTFCKENGMMYKPQECFDYMMELPDKYPQMSIFDL